MLYLLHGGGDNETKWHRRVPVERIFSGLKVLVVMPDGGLSYYTDTVCGENYWTYLSEELPEVIRSYFPVSEKGRYIYGWTFHGRIRSHETCAA